MDWRSDCRATSHRADTSHNALIADVISPVQSHSLDQRGNFLPAPHRKSCGRSEQQARLLVCLDDPEGLFVGGEAAVLTHSPLPFHPPRFHSKYKGIDDLASMPRSSRAKPTNRRRGDLVLGFHLVFRGPSSWKDATCSAPSRRKLRTRCTPMVCGRHLTRS